MLKENEGQEQNCVGLTVQREARCTNDLLGFSDAQLLDLCGYAQDWTDYPRDSIEHGTVWHLDKEKTPFGRILDKCDWNPLEDDADAFNLMVKFGLEVRGQSSPNQVFIEVNGENKVIQRIDGDARKATRRAIVLAVAQIGRART
jgi:hypothetical protein